MTSTTKYSLLSAVPLTVPLAVNRPPCDLVKYPAPQSLDYRSKKNRVNCPLAQRTEYPVATTQTVLSPYASVKHVSIVWLYA